MESPSLEKQYLGVEEILEQRGNRYGKFSFHAATSQEILLAFNNGCMKAKGQTFKQQADPYMVEAIQMICHKLARIANGDPFYDDSWIDIAGYAQLVVDELHEEKK